MTFKANSKEDVERLAQRIREVPSEDRWQLAADVCSLGLMNFRHAQMQDFIAEWRVTQPKMIYVFFETLDKLSEGFNIPEEESIKSFIEDTILHLKHGIDTEDADSVGGWSQREIDLLVTKRGWND